MAEVTDIKRQKRKDSRYNVYIDGEYVFALSDLELSTSGIQVGQVLERGEVEEFKASAKQAKVYALAVRFIGVRPRSKREMNGYLSRKGFESAVIEQVVGRLEDSRLLDDRVFAETWVANRNALRPRSRRALEQELLAKGIGREDIQGVLSRAVTAGDEVDLAGEIAKKKRRLPQYQDEAKLISYLMRQGFSYETTKKALERLDAG